MRTLDPILLAAQESNTGEPIIYLEIKTGTILYPTKYSWRGNEIEATIPGKNNVPTTFRIVRGLKISGTEYKVASPWFFPKNKIISAKETSIFGHIAYDQAHSTAGDVAVETVLTNLLADSGIGITIAATYGDADWWHGIQFLPTGKIASANTIDQTISLMQQKYLAKAFFRYGDETTSNLLFIGPNERWVPADEAYTPHHTFTTEYFNEVYSTERTNTYKYFRSVDENGSITTYGDASYSPHNLGFIPSTTTAEPFPSIDWIQGSEITLAPPRLQIESGDVVSYISAIFGLTSCPHDVIETFDASESPSWKMVLKPIKWTSNTEGGAMPATIERVANYTPLNTSYFNGVLSSHNNNVQSAMDELDDHNHIAPQNHIVNADGTLADITTKFNDLLAKLETVSILKTS